MHDIVIRRHLCAMLRPTLTSDRHVLRLVRNLMNNRVFITSPVRLLQLLVDRYVKLFTLYIIDRYCEMRCKSLNVVPDRMSDAPFVLVFRWTLRDSLLSWLFASYVAEVADLCGVHVEKLPVQRSPRNLVSVSHTDYSNTINVF